MLLELDASEVTPGIREEREDLISCHPSLLPWPQKKWMRESWCGMLLPASPSAGQAGAVGRSLCHAVYKPLRRSRPDNHVCQGRAEVKATPGKCFKRTGLHPVAPILLSSVAEHPPHKALKNARKPCSTPALMGRGGHRPGQGLFPTEGAATDGMPRHAVGSAGWQALPAEV